ncbi:6-phospho-beta-glucosidase [Amycolatopsis sp. H20-H5]|uniref:6-phospho-beta-glucosidase n=1 Tax=Amycolatopsis sp. H20-H5 TaxID=3046309 RepID=UPI002DBD6201|nr:6-phospho-beta-glucosidase [Amycolatopsis sp. H20-H5]MEC3978996.1 6-phospho-beta-glucosidase [Amycolatopsis sp. H20-H5]
MKLVILGGGGFRVPLVHQSLLSDPGRIVDELVLHDLAGDRLRAIRAVLDQQAAGRAWRPRVRATTDLAEALSGADVVFSAIRVGGLHGRCVDERVALAQGLIGQETVGLGGICYALRTVPVALKIARKIAALAPDAWVINFTNPAGVITEAMSSVLGDRVIGICDSPVGLCRRVAGALGLPFQDLRFDYLGLNHLGWLRAVWAGDDNRLPELLSDEAALTSFEEGKLFGPNLLRALGAIPNEYLHYYYFRRETLQQMRQQHVTRGQFLRTQQQSFYLRVEDAPDVALRTWQATRAERDSTYLAEARAVAGAEERQACDVDGGGYEQVALALMAALMTDRPSTQILNVRAGGAVPGMDENAVVEIPCTVDAKGPRPVPVATVDHHSLGLMHQVRAAERAAIRAATTRSREQALYAMVTHPLVDSVAAAERALDGYCRAFPELADLARFR